MKKSMYQMLTGRCLRMYASQKQRLIFYACIINYLTERGATMINVHHSDIVRLLSFRWNACYVQDFLTRPFTCRFRATIPWSWRHFKNAFNQWQKLMKCKGNFPTANCQIFWETNNQSMKFKTNLATGLVQLQKPWFACGYNVRRAKWVPCVGQVTAQW